VTKKPSVDALPWDRNGLSLRFQHYAPTLAAPTRDFLVSTCLNASGLFKLTTPELFEQVVRQLLQKNKRR